MVPGLAGTAVAQDASLCDDADAAGPGGEADGYEVVLLTGGSGSQIVLGYDGVTLTGGSGDDILCAWGTGNILEGGSGNDLLVAMDSPGNAFFGGSGNDTMFGYAGDFFDEGSGNDTRNDVPAVAYDLWVEEFPGPGIEAFRILGSGFTPDSTVSLTIIAYNLDEQYLVDVGGQVDADSQGDFKAWEDTGTVGCSVPLLGQDIGYVTIAATDSTGDTYTETFTREQTCFE